MPIKLLVISIFVAFCFGISTFQNCGIVPSNNTNVQTNSNQTQTQADCPPPTAPFPSYATDKTINQDYGPPEWYCRERTDEAKQKSFPIFQLSQDYSQIPASFSGLCAKEECPWVEFDFKTQPFQYMQAILKYAYKGNLETDWQNLKGWYGAPYMHLDTAASGANNSKYIEPVGREFMHGLTMERVVCNQEINNTTTKPQCKFQPDIRNLAEGYYHDWATSFYNARGGFYINKVWTEIKKGEGKVDWNVLNQGFPDGTVAIKLLFTKATPKDAAYLENSVEWQADVLRRIKPDGSYTEKECLENNLPSEKCFPTVRLLQIDVAVKDSRAVETGWVFGTFIYNKDAKEFIDYEFDKSLSADEIAKKKAWLRLEPIGLMFGNDPKAMLNSAETDEDDGRIVQSVNNPFITIRQHLGCGGRLSGPVDNPRSSCLSCHAFSQTPDNLNPDSVPYGSISCKENKDIVSLFRNIKSPATSGVPGYAGKVYTLDYSLQLREGIFRYWLETNKCYLSAEDLKRCFGAKNQTSIENPLPKTETIKSTLDRDGIEKVE